MKKSPRGKCLLYWALAGFQALMIVLGTWLWIRGGQSTHGEMPTHGVIFVIAFAVLSLLLLALAWFVERLKNRRR